MRTHGRKRRILLHDSDFRGKFRIVRHFSCRNAVFHLFHTPEPAFPTLPRDYGSVRCSTIPKTAEKWNRATFTGHGTCRSGRNHAIMARKNTSTAPLFIHFDDPGLPIGNRDQESRKYHRFVYVSKEQLTFCIFCFQLPKHATKLLEFNMLKRLEYLHVVNAYIPEQGE